MLHSDPEMCSLSITSKITCNMKQRKGRRIWSSHWPCQQDLFQPPQQRWAGHSPVSVCEPRGQVIGFRQSFCEAAPWPIPPVWLAGMSNRVDVPARDISIQMSENSAPEQDVPFPRPPAGGNGRASASQGLSPGYWCPLPTSRRRKSLMG